MENHQPMHTAVLTAENSQSQRFVAQLQEGKSVIVGSGQSCGLFLDDPEVATMHCSFRFCDGQLWVQDWCSDSGTFVNGRRISDETVVPSGATVAVGQFTISVQTSGPPQVAGAGQNRTGTSRSLPSEPDRQPDSPAPLVQGDPPRGTESELSSFDAGEQADNWSSWDQPAVSQMLPGNGDCFDNETIELLRGEIEHLQGELSERDARIAELESGVVANDDAMDQPSDDVVGLSGRLEQLLEELTLSDERIDQLEEMLRLSDDANRAEQEERHQLEAWVSDIERRIGQREEEWKAAHQQLQKRAEQLKAERDHVEQRLQRAASSSGADSQADYQGVLERLRKQNDELQAALLEAQKEHASLQDEHQQLKENHSEAAQRAQVDDTLREERAQVARERAELARLRVELANRISEAERQLNTKENSEVDTRLQLLREHLKEIHKEEKSERVERGLPHRLARLWKRLDG